MTKFRALIALMRLDKPVGIFLLWFPIAWALTLAYHKYPPLDITLWFALGTIVMRSAGCVINDIADRHWDANVTRTSQRPLATCQISLQAAWLLFFALILLALGILLQLPKNCFFGALPAAGLTLIYPFCKRFFATPQVILGLAFACGIPMVALASNSTWSLDWSLLLMITVLWVLAYDTQYALADVEDDKQVGIRSSANFFNRYVHAFIYSLQALISFLWVFYGLKNDAHSIFFVLCGISLFFWLYQRYLVSHQQPLRAFKNNTWYGLYIWVMLLLAKMI